MDKKQYLTVKEFSEKVGISRQAVYQQLNKKLKDFVKVVDNVKMIDIQAFETFQDNNYSKAVEQDTINNQSTLDNLIDMIEILKNQLEIKDNQIKDLTRLLDQEQQLAKMEKQKALPEAINVEVSETIQDEPTTEEPKKKRSWLDRIIKKQ